MNFDQIYQFFESPPPRWLSVEMAVVYVASVLLDGDSYGVQIQQEIGVRHPGYCLSDTVLYAAFEFFEREKAVETYWLSSPTRGRPRKFYRITSSWRDKAEKLAELWLNFLDSKR